MESTDSTPATCCPLLRWLPGLLLAGISSVAAASPVPAIHSLADLQNVAVTNDQAIASFSVTGVVCSAEAESRLVALQDETATVLLELPELDPAVRPGDGLVIEGRNTALARNRTTLLLGTAPVTEIDALHPPLSRSGRVFLTAGMQPVRLEWFNGRLTGELGVTYEGPGVSPQRIPDRVLQHRASDPSVADEFQPGLNFTAYEGTDWIALPDFQTLTPVATGIVANFDVSRYSEQSPVAMRFTGFLQIPRAGVYTFRLTSDDGARLFVGNPAAQCVGRRLERGSPPPTPKTLAEALARGAKPQWVSLQGKVRFASRRGSLIELELMEPDQPVSVLIADSAQIPITDLAGQRVQVTGICRRPSEARTPLVVVPGAGQFRILRAPRATLPNEEPITTAAQVRGLQPEVAGRGLHALLRGVVTTATFRSCVVQDSSGAIFVQPSRIPWPHQPIVGELWQFEGSTDPGEFSPILIATNAVCLGKSVLPQPIQPSWEQLINGSMDVELIELLGVVLAMDPEEMTLLTHGGEVIIQAYYEYTLPDATALLKTNQTLIGSLVRVRGVFFAYRDPDTRELIPGRFLLGDALLSVVEPTPDDPFSVPSRHVTDLLHFTTHVDVLTRFKIAGQVLYAQPGDYFLGDEGNGFRVMTKDPLPLAEGDLVEAVGFPELGGPSPVLVQATARKTGHAPLPPPRAIPTTELLDASNDSTLVQLEALLLSDVLRLGERVLELQAGGYHFLARLRTADQPATVLRPGSRLQLTGVYASTRGSAANTIDGFELLLNRPSDIVVLQSGPWWTRRHTFAAIAILLIGLGMSLIWVGLLHRTVAQRTALLEREIGERQQTEHRRLLEEERTRVAHDLHDDLGAGLAQISLIGSLAQRPNTLPDRARGLLSEITDKSREMIAVLDEIVWAINPQHDTARSVSGYLSDYAQEFLRPSAIVCRLDSDCARSEHVLNSKQRHQLFLAFKEALTNVVKHAQATEVRIRTTAQPDELRVSVEDNGRGMPSSPNETGGNGTRNMRDRLNQIGGRCEIQPRPGGGTVVSFHVPTTR